MSFIYIWKSSGTSPEHAHQKFLSVLSKQCKLYKDAFGRDFTMKVLQIDSIFIGQIQFDMGVKQWSAWFESNNIGFAWSGICEDYLGITPNERTVQELFNIINNNTEQVSEWAGRFALCTWDTSKQQVVLTTAATESPTLWYTEGVNGWAVGSRALPILQLVGLQPQLDPNAANLFIAYGYLFGTNALLKNVVRLPSRRKLIIGANSKPAIQTYLSLRDYLQGQERPTKWHDRIEQGAERIVSRVNRQLMFSQGPQMPLTGGRDSRCITAAAVKAGYSGTTYTFGHPNSVDVIIAAKVAKRLGIKHEHRKTIGGTTSPMGVMTDSIDAVKLWTQISEGVETIRHALSFQEFFLRDLPFPHSPQQVFHGLGGEIARRTYFYPNNVNLDATYRAEDMYSLLVEKMPANLVLRNSIKDASVESFLHIDREIGMEDISTAQWLGLLYWQNRCLHWGEDMMSIKDVIEWHWAPLLDKIIIQSSWDINAQGRIGKRFIEDVILSINPVLGNIEYDKRSPHSPITFGLTKRKLLKEVNRYTRNMGIAIVSDTARVPIDQYLFKFWDVVLFGKQEHVWHQFIQEELLRDILAKNPLSEVLWSVATIELFAQTHCS